MRSVSTTTMTAAGRALRLGDAGNGERKRGEGRAESEFVHQNAVPTLKVISLVSSPSALISALAISILNGPNGEFQLTPKPTERRGLGGIAEIILVEGLDAGDQDGAGRAEPASAAGVALPR